MLKAGINPELGHEIHWKPLKIALDGLHQHLGLHPVQRGQLNVEHHALLS